MRRDLDDLGQTNGRERGVVERGELGSRAGERDVECLFDVVISQQPEQEEVGAHATIPYAKGLLLGGRKGGPRVVVRGFHLTGHWTSFPYFA